MLNRIMSGRGIRFLMVFIILIQLFDIFIHVATGQAEPIRILANILLIIWLLREVVGQSGQLNRALAFSAIGLYAVLNLIFLVREGIVNDETGSLRFVLFFLVGISVALSLVLSFMADRKT